MLNKHSMLKLLKIQPTNPLLKQNITIYIIYSTRIHYIYNIHVCSIPCLVSNGQSITSLSLSILPLISLFYFPIRSYYFILYFEVTCISPSILVFHTSYFLILLPLGPFHIYNTIPYPIRFRLHPF